MEIKVFKDVAAREKTWGKLTPAQWCSLIFTAAFIVLDAVNAVFKVVPGGIEKIIGFILVGGQFYYALAKPHGLRVKVYLKILWMDMTRIQTRVYGRTSLEKGETNVKYKKTKINECEL